MTKRFPVQRHLCLLLAAGIGTALSGCAVGKKPSGEQELLQPPIVADPLRSLQQRAERFQGLRALMRLQYRDPKETHSSREAIVVARPDRLRVEVLSLFGSVFLLATDKGRLLAYVPEERTVYLGAASAENLWRYTRLWIPVEDLVDLLLATPGYQRAQLAHCPPGDAAGACLSYPTHTGEATVWLDRAALPLRVEHMGADGTLLWTARYESFETHSTVPVVKQLAVESPAFGRKITLQFHDVEINPELEGDEFTLHYPAETQVVNLEEEQ